MGLGFCRKGAEDTLWNDAGPRWTPVSAARDPFDPWSAAPPTTHAEGGAHEQHGGHEESPWWKAIDTGAKFHTATEFNEAIEAARHAKTARQVADTAGSLPAFRGAAEAVVPRDLGIVPKGVPVPEAPTITPSLGAPKFEVGDFLAPFALASGIHELAVGDTPDKVFGGLEAFSGGVGTLQLAANAGTLVANNLAAEGAMSAAELAGSAEVLGGMGQIAARLHPLGALAGAAAGGYQLGKWLDGKFHIGDHVSDALFGSLDDQIFRNTGCRPQKQRGVAGISENFSATELFHNQAIKIQHTLRGEHWDPKVGNYVANNAPKTERAQGPLDHYAD